MSVFAPGMVLDERFEVIEEVWQGGMGVVYRAQDKRIGRTVALKALREQMALDAESIQRFKREAQLISVLKHPHIMEIFSVSVTREGIPFFAMEFLEGEQLSELLERHGALSWREVLPMMIDVCDALQYAHEQKIVHRDIKPSNIMLVRDGERTVVKLVDFGIAKSVSENAPKLTKTNMMLGSVPYMSPSDFAGAPASSASDVYALGCTMVELLSGKPPFMGETVFDTISQHSNQPVPTLKEMNAAANADAPPDLQKLINWMLEKRVEDRAPSAVAVRDCLRAILDGKSVPIGTRKPALRTGKRGWVIAAACLAIVVCGTLITQSRPFKVAYLTNDKQEKHWVAAIQQNPKDGAAWAELGELYTHVLKMAAADSVLRKALSLPLKPELRARALLALAGNENAYGDYESAIKHCKESMELADKRKRYIGQKLVLLSAYTPAGKYEEQVKLAEKSLAEVREQQHISAASFNAVYMNTVEALLVTKQYDKAIKLADSAADVDNFGFSTRLLKLVARNKLGNHPTDKEFEEAEDQVMRGAPQCDQGLAHMLLAWGKSAKSSSNKEGMDDATKSVQLLLNARDSVDLPHQIRVFNTAIRVFGYVVPVSHDWLGEKIELGNEQRQLIARRDELVNQAKLLSEPVPVNVDLK